ncbi:uncharacterized protein N7511_008323 [Penicillium nucicola]|uniref:uncharacterized protein n=1 Tax=Penicillium nucicola TaxID=1850975 RepID=UPI002545428E|nr:uncharacterized protein N7511_008323 [Penicillium nucicola]KAJ5754170.1 hypothetical protein N7511_008323 [Penicillium nucicola]
MAPKRSIIITGGASGIGLGITQHFITEPETHITILDISSAAGTQTLERLHAEFPLASVSFEQCDVSSWESQAEVFNRVVDQQGRIDIVFANAGITEKGTLLPEKDGDKTKDPVKPDLSTLNVNLVGVVYSIKLATHYMSYTSDTASTSKGLIVCTASNAGLYPFAMAPMYAATKAGVIGLVRSLAPSLAVERIQINALAPAVIQTNIAPSSALFDSMILTPMSTVTKGVAQFVADPSLTGQVAELHGEHVTFAEPPAYVDEDTGKNIAMFSSLGYA